MGIGDLRLEIGEEGDWRLEIGDWRFEIGEEGDWRRGRLEIGDWGGLNSYLPK